MSEAAHWYDDHVAEHYDRDAFSVFSESRRAVLAQLERHTTLRADATIVDVGCGTGQWLAAVGGKLKSAHLVGIEPSEGMLAIARRTLAAKGLVFSGHAADGLAMREHVGMAKADLLSMHFVLAYVPAKEIFQRAFEVLAPGGWLSIVTSTMESLPTMQAAAAAFVDDATIHDTVQVPASPAETVELVEAAGFSVLDASPMHIDIVLADFDALYDFGVNQGWLVSYKREIERIAKEHIPVPFPLRDAVRAVVVLAQKPR